MSYDHVDIRYIVMTQLLRSEVFVAQLRHKSALVYYKHVAMFYFSFTRVNVCIGNTIDGTISNFASECQFSSVALSGY